MHDGSTNDRMKVVFDVEGTTYTAALNPMEIVHDGIHHAIPEDIRRGKRLILRAPGGVEVYPDMFAGEVVRGYGDGEQVTLTTTIIPIKSSPGPWRNIGFDHLAIALADRDGACAFFSEVLGMQIMRHDPHLTVLSTGHTGLFLFDIGDDIPMSDGTASRWHHIGFVVDNLEHAFYHLEQHAALVSDFTLLERQERWSLYGHYQNGDVNFMIQLSEIRDGWRGFAEPQEITDYLYDYSGQQYGKRLEG
ncbi:MAG: VOC family protein [Thermomicrobiales bacterium]|nr:VOC family protein [Thermomicrobiales bacterium]